MSLRLPDFSAVIFDLDGLVLDSEPTYAAAWKKAAAEFGAYLDEDFLLGLFGRHAEDVEMALAQRIGPAFDQHRDRYHAAAARCWRAHVDNHGIATLPGVDNLLALLDHRGIPYALATNSSGPNAKECLRLAGLEGRFAWMVTRDQVVSGKPEPDLFLQTAKLMGVAAEQCLVLEDSTTGLLAAQRAGAIPLLVLARPAPAESIALAFLAYNNLDEFAGHLATHLQS